MKPDLLENNLPFYDRACVAMILPATNSHRISTNFESLCNEIEYSNPAYASKLNIFRSVSVARCFLMFNKKLL